MIILCGAMSPYAPTGVGTENGVWNIGRYSYDSANNRLSNGLSAEKKQQIAMGLISKPVTIQLGENSEKAEIVYYAPGGERFLRLHADGRMTLYIDDFEYRIPIADAIDTTPKSIVYIHAKGYSPDVLVNVNANPETRYVYFFKRPSGQSRQLSGCRGQSGAVRPDGTDGRPNRCC